MTRRSAIWLYALATVILAVSLAACGSQPAAPAAQPTAPASKPAAAAPTNSPAPTKAAAPAAAPTSAPAAQAAAPTSAPAAQKTDYPTKTITFIAPSKPSSGYDTTARAVANVIEKEKLLPVALPVMNSSSVPEGMATIVQQHKNDPNMIAVQSIAIMMKSGDRVLPLRLN